MEKKEISKTRMVCSVIAGIAVGSIVALSLLGGNGNELEQQSQKQEQSQSQSQSQSQGSIEIANNSYVTAEFEKAYEAPGIEGAFYVDLNVQNKTDKTIWVYLDSASVNNEIVSMVSTGVPLNIAPGNSGETGFIFPTAQLSVDSVSDVRNITFDLVVADKETLEEIDRVKGVSVDL